MSNPELELGLTPKLVRPNKVIDDGAPRAVYSWHRYTAGNRRYCDACMVLVPKIGGAPTRALDKAWWTEDGPEGRMWLCQLHKVERENWRGQEQR